MKHPDMVQNDPRKMPVTRDGRRIKRLRFATCQCGASWVSAQVFEDDTEETFKRDVCFACKRKIGEK